MPCEYRIDTAHGLVLSRASGSLTDADLLDHHARMVEDPAFEPSMNQVFTFHDVDEVSGLTTAGIRALAERNPFGPGSRRAFLTSKRVVFGMLRIFQTLTEDYPDELRVVFDEAHLARKWVGAPDAD